MNSGCGKYHPWGCGGASPPGDSLLVAPTGADSTHRRFELGLILWIIAVVLVVAGIVSFIRGELLYGAALVVLGLLVGPGGVSIFT